MNLHQILRKLTCLRMYTNNYTALVLFEKAIHTETTYYSDEVKKQKGHEYNRETFHNKITPSDMFRLFYPMEDANLFETLLLSKEIKKSTHTKLEHQMKINHIWAECIHDLINVGIFAKEHFFTHFDEKTDQRVEECVSQHKTMDHLPPLKTFASRTSAIDSAFQQSVTIDLDPIPGDGNCFFHSIRKQFETLVEDPKDISVDSLRLYIHEYSSHHFQSFTEAVAVWQTMYKLESQSEEWAFFTPYHTLTPKNAAAKMLDDKVFLKSTFWAEQYSIALTLNYIEWLTGYRIMVILIDSEIEPSFLVGTYTQRTDANLFSFFYRSHQHYQSFQVNNQRVFSKQTLPLLTFHLLVSHKKLKTE